MKARLTYPALLSGLLLIVGGCSGGKAAAPPPPPEVEVATVVERDTPIYTDWVASLDGYVNADIEPRVAGYIIKQNDERTNAVNPSRSRNRTYLPPGA